MLPSRIPPVAWFTPAAALLVACGSGREVAATSPGVIATFDASALHAEADLPALEGDARPLRARCTYRWPDDPEQGFDLLVEATYYADAELGGVSVEALRSDCAIETTVEAPARHLEVAGSRDTRATLRVTYECPSGRGSAGLSVSFLEGIDLGGSSARCEPLG